MISVIVTDGEGAQGQAEGSATVTNVRNSSDRSLWRMYCSHVSTLFMADLRVPMLRSQRPP